MFRIMSAVFLACAIFSFGCGVNSDAHLGKIRIDAGPYDRMDAPIRFNCQYSDIFGAEGPGSAEYLILREQNAAQIEIPAQWHPAARLAWEQSGTDGTLVFILSGETRKGVTRTFDLFLRSGSPPRSSVAVNHSKDKNISVTKNGKPVLSYNYGIVR